MDFADFDELADERSTDRIFNKMWKEAEARLMTAPWKMFLDDVRTLEMVFTEKQIEKLGDIVICRSFKEGQIACVERKSLPSYVAFDHDLGVDPYTHELDPTGDDFAFFLIHQDQWARDNMASPREGDLLLPEGFTFTVHSSNPDGAKNIASKLNSYLRVRKESL